MNTSEITIKSQKPQSEFLTEIEKKDFEVWKDRKVYTGSKPYETNGKNIENSSNRPCI
jgi:hypothetical protein